MSGKLITLPLAALIAALTLGRLVAAYWIPLTEDEAYYRLWAQHLHLGYYDHPPMIAWWIALGTRLVGDTTLGVRLIPILATGFATWLIADLTHVLGGQSRTAFRAALWYNATITIGAGGILAIPDAPAALFWLATLTCLGRFWAGGTSRWWLLAGVMAGLACLSKYSALFLAPGTLLWLGLTPQGRKALTTPWPWLAGVVAGVVFSANIYWNAQNDWLTFEKQFGRVLAQGLEPKHLGDLLVSQFFLLNPLIVIYAIKGFKRLIEPKLGLLLPLATGAPFAAYLIAHSLHDRVQAHWPAPLIAGIVILAVMAVERSSNTQSVRGLRAFGVAIYLALSAITLALMAGQPDLKIGRADPLLPVRGWSNLAGDLNQLSSQEQTTWIGTAAYGTLAQLLASRKLTRPAIQLIERARYRDGTPAVDFTKPGLVIDLDRRLRISDLRACFTSVESKGVLVRGGRPGKNADYAVYRVLGPRADIIATGCPNDLGKLPRR